ncbi:hypothetical protein FPQ18DRAFT_82040 [Pyronema domesticum]|uniref:Uncharacterized protein n=1 Tax=Pyronema omphalodes (strain CBS 100304) TaxID=1076935 RepID=U4LN98_PYROM|nr:hypothetical protein FPQ18DRAFT_82040 [Pyronema domesticum]CCX33067.1 Similar to hypothetical protein [Tuber melanosporum Mel28]; acc. no. XP_002836822 [Pyronema omphalodes CBS 100304]
MALTPPTSETLRKQFTTFLDTQGRSFVENPLWQGSNSLGALGMWAYSRKAEKRGLKAVMPRPNHLLFFAALFGVATGIGFEGYTVDAAGTTAAWGTLYLLTNGIKRTITPIYKARTIIPAVFAAKIAFDTVNGAWYWGNTRRWEPESK